MRAFSRKRNKNLSAILGIFLSCCALLPGHDTQANADLCTNTGTSTMNPPPTNAPSDLECQSYSNSGQTATMVGGKSFSGTPFTINASPNGHVTDGWELMGSAEISATISTPLGTCPNLSSAFSNPPTAGAGGACGTYLDTTNTTSTLQSGGDLVIDNLPGYGYFMVEYNYGAEHASVGSMYLQGEMFEVDTTYKSRMSQAVTIGTADSTDVLYGAGMYPMIALHIPAFGSSGGFYDQMIVRIYGSNTPPIHQMGTLGLASGGQYPINAVAVAANGSLTSSTPPKWLPLQASSSGQLEPLDALDMAVALGAPTNTAWVSQTSTVISSSIAASTCYRFSCNSAVNYRVSNGASAAVSTDNFLAANTVEKFCTGTATQTNLTVYPSTASGNCTITSLQALP